MKRISAIFFMFIVILLTVCSDRADGKEENSQETIKMGESSNVGEGNNLGEAQQDHSSKVPIVEEHSNIIHLVVPNTEEIITTISTEELGYEKDYSSYVKQIEQLASDLARGSSSNEGYDQRMVLDKVSVDGELIEGKPMIILKESELVDKILTASPNGGNVELPLYVTETGYDRSEYEALDDVVIASYTTYFNASVVGRSQNIHLSSNAISNVIVGIGDYFSFNTTVGPRTKETGYQEALEIVNGEFVTGIGGGICQTSSTLFNAVDQLGVRYVERHHHSRSIGYVPKGRDATVSYGTLDFRFQNTTAIPFVIYSTTTKDSITVEIRTSRKYAKKT